MVACMERAVRIRRPLPRTSADLADRAQGHDVGDDRRHRRRPDDLAARGARRGTELGLPLLLAARLRARAGGAARCGLYRRGAALPRLPAARRHGRPGLPGYEGSRPVRVGNAASEQFQLDVYGEVVGVMAIGAERLNQIERGLWPRWR